MGSFVIFNDFIPVPSAPRDVTPHSVDSHGFILTWTAPEINNNDITHYEVSYIDTFGTVTHDAFFTVFSTQSLTPGRVYVVRVRASSQFGPGFEADLTIATPVLARGMKSIFSTKLITGLCSQHSK